MMAPRKRASKNRLLSLAFGMLLGLAGPAHGDDAGPLPPPIGEEAPRVIPIKGDGGIYHQEWFVQSFLDLKADFAEAKQAGKRFAIIFEQRGCGYCVKMHKEVLSQKYINEYVRNNFHILQLDLWGGREVTDFDGTKLPESKLAERWGVLFTPTIIYFKDDLSKYEGQWGRDLEVLRMSLGLGPGTFYDMFTWVRHKVYERDANFQRFHVQRYHEREALKAANAKDGPGPVKSN